MASVNGCDASRERRTPESKVRILTPLTEAHKEKELKMATARGTKTSDYAENADPTEVPEDWNWEVVAEGAPTGVIFEHIGDVFVGQYIGDHHVEREPSADGKDQSFDLFIFKGRDGERYSLNKSYALVEAMAKVQPSDWCRIEYVKDVKVANWPTPMKDFKVSVRRG